MRQTPIKQPMTMPAIAPPDKELLPPPLITMPVDDACGGAILPDDTVDATVDDATTAAEEDIAGIGVATDDVPRMTCMTSSNTMR